ANSARYLPALRARAESLGVGKNLEFLGARRNIAAFLAGIDMYVHPSLSEGCPVAVLEAMAAGIPIVATDVGGYSNLVEDSVSGFLVPVDDVDGFKQRVEELAGNAMLRQSMSHKSREFAMGRFGVEPFLREYLRLCAGNRAC
ncbi:MAG: glycosyltransferase, partial [Nitrospirae bacterium]|nr:glycosyltransferase [Nitrospirota bacterium]